MKNESKKLLRRTFAEFLIKVVLWTVGLYLLTFLIAFIVDKWNFEWLFRSKTAYARWVQVSGFLFSGGWIIVLGLVIWVIGDIVLIYGLLRKSFGYINAISQAARELFAKDIEYIELPRGLEEMQKQLNYLKNDVSFRINQG